MTTNSVIIIGAPRSGTNILRDTLAELPGVSTWPCDEINYIWRHGNAHFPSDQLLRNMATPQIKKYIQKKFNQIKMQNRCDLVLEKTCANSLRIPFVDEVLPGAKYIFIVRDGFDVVGSASIRWRAKLDLSYILQKTRYVPLTDLPYYASRYCVNRIKRIFSTNNQLSFWGPSTTDMATWTQNHTLKEVCALQWKACVDSSENDLTSIDPNRVMRIQYEKFVTNPQAEIKRVAKFLEKDFNPTVLDRVCSGISSRSVGKGRSSLSEQEINGIRPLISATLRRYGYGC
jgi:hypothetical protein